MTARERRYDIVSEEQLEKLRDSALPGMDAGSRAAIVHYRDLYLDTDDDALLRRQITCRLRIGSDDRRVITVIVGSSDDPESAQRFEEDVDTGDPRAVLAGNSEPVRRLAAVVDFRLLQTRLELQIERVERSGDADWLGRPRVSVQLDHVFVQRGTMRRSFQQATVRGRGESESFEKVCADLHDSAGLRPIVAGTRERAQLLLKWMEREEKSRARLSDSGVALVITSGTRVALLRRGGLLMLPFEIGSGVGVARTLLERCTRNPGSDTRMLGKLTSIGPMPTVEVWTAELAVDGELAREQGETTWLRPLDALDRAAEMHPDSIAALTVAMRSGLLMESTETAIDPRRTVEITAWNLGSSALDPRDAPVTGDPNFLNSEISILEFIARVLAMAEDLRTPLAERLRFLSIVSSNLDEFFMVRVAGIKRSASEQAEERSPDGLTPRQQLDLVRTHARSLLARQYRCYSACAAEAAPYGLRIMTWNELDVSRRDQLRAQMRDELLPALTPLAMTLSPGHPFPKLQHLSLSLAVVLLDGDGTAPHFAQVELPDDAPRFTAVPGMNAVIAMEELVRANLDMVYPSSVIEQAYAFRVTRGADIEIDEERAASLLHAVEEASQRRFDQPVVRIEVERSMPAVLRDVVLRELRREHGGSALALDDVFEVDGPLDLRALDSLDLPKDRGLHFPPFEGSNAFPAEPGIFAIIDERDRLVHHPYEEFSTSVVRFFTEAAGDPAVTAIKLTIYRADESSPIVAALVDAASAGKDVVVFVELKARFDEERNVAWAKRLEAAGGRVVHGLVGYKNHAKVALVVRKVGSRFRRYAHVGTGNYNATTARRYTDLSLFTADDDLTADVQDLFNELTGSSRAPQHLSRGCLVSPHQLLPELIAKIEREAQHARAGREARIRIKVNGLSDPDIVHALIRASRDGVKVDLVVRGVCTLRPGIAGATENVRVVSVLGRFLEHSRVLHFANAGRDEYYIGSADLRPRNLRRRVELYAPVKDAACRAMLDGLLDRYINDPAAWELEGDGGYVRRTVVAR